MTWPIERADHAVHAQLSLRDGDLGDLRIERAHVIPQRNALEAAGRELFTPARFRGGEFENGEQARRFGEKPAAHFDRVLAAERAQFSSELTAAIAQLAARYHDASALGGRPHRLVLVAHPLPQENKEKAI